MCLTKEKGEKTKNKGFEIIELLSNNTILIILWRFSLIWMYGWGKKKQLMRREKDWHKMKQNETKIKKA